MFQTVLRFKEIRKEFLQKDADKFEPQKVEKFKTIFDGFITEFMEVFEDNKSIEKSIPKV